MKTNITITEAQLGNIIKERLKKVLNEGISDTTYHFTSLYSCVDILKNNTFNLTMSSNRSDAYDHKRLFYLSTQRGRSKDIGYANHLSSCVRIQLDGNALRTKYAGKPIDYWGASMGKQYYYKDDPYNEGMTSTKQHHPNFEMEDRIFSYEPTIGNASKYINRIDVYIKTDTNDTKRLNNEKETAVIIWVLGKRNKIPVYIYDNLKDFNFMTDNIINNEIEQLYKDDFHAKTERDYSDQPLYRAHKDISHKNKYVTILLHLLNVLSDGEIFRKDNRAYALISNTLHKFGLEQYRPSVMSELKRTRGYAFNESCRLLSNTSNVPIRKLNTEDPDEDSNRIMRLGAWILKNKGTSNFDQLISYGN